MKRSQVQTLRLPFKNVINFVCLLSFGWNTIYLKPDAMASVRMHDCVLLLYTREIISKNILDSCDKVQAMILPWEIFSPFSSHGIRCAALT